MKKQWEEMVWSESEAGIKQQNWKYMDSGIHRIYIAEIVPEAQKAEAKYAFFSIFPTLPSIPSIG